MTRPLRLALALAAAFAAGVLAAPQHRVIVADLPAPPIVADLPAPLIKEILP